MELNDIIGKIHNCDCLDLLKQIPDKSCDLIFTDPPYNLDFSSYESLSDRNGRKLHNTENLDWDKSSKIDMKEISKSLFMEFDRILKFSGSVLIFGGMEWAYYYYEPAINNNFDLKCQMVWVKCLHGRQMIIARVNGEYTYIGIRDLYRAIKRGEIVELFSDKNKWIKVLNIIKQEPSPTVHLYLKNGGILKITTGHLFRVNNKFAMAGELKKGDVLDMQYMDFLPEKDNTIFDYNLGWLVGLFLAEGNYCKNNTALSFSLHSKEIYFYKKLYKIVKKYNSCIRKHCYGNKMVIIIENTIISSIVQYFIKDKGSLEKNINLNRIFKTNKKFVSGLIQGYLDGDGHKRRTKSESYRLGFGYNVKLANNLMILCNLVGYNMSIKKSYAKYQNGIKKCFKGTVSFNNLNDGKLKPTQIIRISNVSPKVTYEIALEQDHTYIMPEGVISHNSNPIPQIRHKNYRSAHENIVWFGRFNDKCPFTFNFINQQEMKNVFEFPILGGEERLRDEENQALHPTQKPIKLIQKLLRIHSNENDVVADCFAGSGTIPLACRQMNRQFYACDINEKYCKLAQERIDKEHNQLKLEI